MIKERENVITKINLIFQVLLAVGSFFVTSLLYYSFSTMPDIYGAECVFQITLIAFIWLVLIKSSRLCFILKEQTQIQLLLKYLKTILWGTVLLYSVFGLVNIGERNFLFWMLFYIVNFVMLYSSKVLFYKLMRFIRKNGDNRRQILIIADEMSFDSIERMTNSKDWGYKIWGVITNSPKIKASYKDKCNILSYNQQLSEVLDKHAIDEVFYIKGEVNSEEVNKIIRLCTETGIVFNLRPAFNYCKSVRPEFNMFGNSPVLTYQNIPDDYLSLKIKRFFDILFSMSVLTLGAPFFLIIALIIKLYDGGPVFFVQERVGLNGRSFSCLKFRTMVVNAEALQQQLKKHNEQTGPVFKIRMDPRVTKVGRFLRKTSLDELPQFLNVLHGDMSIVGPRPPIPAEVKEYKREYNRRLSMKPGITCIWQVSGRNNISFEDWMQLDMKYIDNWSLFLDLRIILKTVKVMLIGDGQ